MGWRRLKNPYVLLAFLLDNMTCAAALLLRIDLLYAITEPLMVPSVDGPFVSSSVVRLSLTG